VERCGNWQCSLLVAGEYRGSAFLIAAQMLSDETMKQLDRVTTLYSQEQDRISLNALDKQGGSIRLWLTQRIFARLVPRLAKLVEPKHDDPVYASVLASVAQQRAVEQQEPAKPVQLVEVAQEWLVCKIDMKMSPAGIILIFASADGERAQLAMNGGLLRQWLAILRRVYQSAEWKGTDWPDWMDPPVTTQRSSQILH
jgi:hypothetical protein